LKSAVAKGRNIFFCDLNLKTAAAKNRFALPNFTQKRNLRIKDGFGFARGCLTVCITCVWAGVDSLWEQEKLEARKMLENAARPAGSPTRQVHALLARFLLGRIGQNFILTIIPLYFL